jgi:hypothetical protein
MSLFKGLQAIQIKNFSPRSFLAGPGLDEPLPDPRCIAAGFAHAKSYSTDSVLQQQMPVIMFSLREIIRSPPDRDANGTMSITKGRAERVKAIVECEVRVAPQSAL